MVKCVVRGCDMQRARMSNKRSIVKFYPIPTIRETGPPWSRMRSVLRRRAWLFIIDNDDLKDEYAKITKRICSRHFVSGKPSGLRDEHNPDWLPCLHMEVDPEWLPPRYIEVDSDPTSRRTYPTNYPTERLLKVDHVSIATPQPHNCTDNGSPETYSTFLTTKEEIKDEPPDTELQDPLETGVEDSTTNDMVTLRCDDFKIMEDELQRLRSENADLKKSYTKLRNQLTEADVDKLELKAELSEVKRTSEETAAKNRALLEENVFLTNKIISCETLVKTLQEEAKTRVNKIATLEYSLDKMKRISVCIEALQEDEDYVTFYTGFPFHQNFEMCLNHVRSRVTEPRSVLAPWQCFFLTLIRLRLSLTLQDLAYRFGVSRSTACNTFERWLYHLYQSLNAFLERPEREDIKKAMTDSFKEAFSDNVVMILHCFELFSDSSKSTDNRGALSAKPRSSVKYFIGMNPCGAISFVSRGWETRKNAVKVLAESGLYETLQHGDEIISDHGLPSCESVGWCCAKVIDSKRSGQVKFRCEDITENRRMTMLRGQVDRIGSLRRKYRILRGELPIQDLHKKTAHDVPQTDQIVRACCALSNIAEKYT